MLNHTKKIKEIYEVIQKMIFYMIPEKWDKLYLYSSVIDQKNDKKTGELYFYYIPKGIIRKKPVNVYEIPNKFNVDETEYLKLVKALYEKIKQLREEFRKIEKGKVWSNITIIIENYKFKVEYNYEDLVLSDFNSYERHIIWRYKYLNIKPEQMNKRDREIINRYINGVQVLYRKEKYEVGIYIKDIENVVAFNTVKEDSEEIDETDELNEPEKPKEIHNKKMNTKKSDYVPKKQPQEINKKARKNQILLAADEIRKLENQEGGN